MRHAPFARNIAAIATPFRADLSVDFESLVSHAEWLFAQGCDGIVLFGTTGEAASLTIGERMRTLEELVRAGIGPQKIVVGTGCCAAEDTITLTRHAARHECAGALILPPFFYKSVSDDGVARIFEHVLDACGDAIPVYLYNIPQVSGVGISPALVTRLRARYGDSIRGYKDSSGNWNNSAEILAAHPTLHMYVGAETLLSDNLEVGGAGCISASANVQPRGIRKIFDASDPSQRRAAQEMATTVRKTLEKAGPLATICKSVLARIHHDDAWEIVRPPLVPPSDGTKASLFAELRALDFPT